MCRIAALWRKQNETEIPFLENSFVGQPNQAGEDHRVGACFGWMKKDQHRHRFSFTRTASAAAWRIFMCLTSSARFI